MASLFALFSRTKPHAKRTITMRATDSDTEGQGLIFKHRFVHLSYGPRGRSGRAIIATMQSWIYAFMARPVCGQTRALQIPHTSH